MTKEQVLKLIHEYQQFPAQQGDYDPEEPMNPDDLLVHEEVATSLRRQLEDNPDFFKELDEKKMRKYLADRFGIDAEEEATAG
ncbi:MAG: hypothetical protein ACRCR3_03995 [Tannerellaceae bacterium]